MRHSSGTNELPLSTRAAGRAYDLLIIGLGFWVLIADIDWIPFSLFVLVNLSGLLIFDNRLLSRGNTLTRPWQAVVIFVGLAVIMLLPFVWNTYEEHPIRGLVALMVFLGTRLLFSRQRHTA